MSNKNYGLAIAAAKEIKELNDRVGQTPTIDQLVDNITGWVGYRGPKNEMYWPSTVCDAAKGVADVEVYRDPRKAAQS